MLPPKSKVNKIWLKPLFFVSGIYIKKTVMSVCLCPLDLDTRLSTSLPPSTNPLHIHQLSKRRVWGRLYTQHHCTRFKSIPRIEYKKSATKKKTTLQLRSTHKFYSSSTSNLLMSTFLPLDHVCQVQGSNIRHLQQVNLTCF
jgi:hypothetical protein